MAVVTIPTIAVPAAAATHVSAVAGMATQVHCGHRDNATSNNRLQMLMIASFGYRWSVGASR